MVRNICCRMLLLMIGLLLRVPDVFALQEITPYKYTNQERSKGLSFYKIPASSRYTLTRENNSELIYYLSKPQQSSFPIAILCGGSSSRNDIVSIIHFYRYFLKEFLDLGCAVVAIEQQGVDNDKINVDEFLEHYTRSARLNDHRLVIDYLSANPPKGWNGKFIFLGVSEGGPLVITLTADYSDRTIATINWAGAGDWPWEDELWVFMKNLEKTLPWHIKVRMKLPSWMPLSIDLYIPNSRNDFDELIGETIKNPTSTKELFGMTYKYHADAITEYPAYDYSKIKTPFLVVAGESDTIIQSCDAFVQKAKNSGAPMTYMRIEGMDHYIRHRPDIIDQSFVWLKECIKK